MFIFLQGMQDPKGYDRTPGAPDAMEKARDQEPVGPPGPSKLLASQAAAAPQCPAICKKVCVGFCPSLKCCANSQIPVVEAKTGGRQQILPISVEVQEDS